MKVLGVTLARGGSKGIPGKNIKTIAGKPLLAWTIDEALKSRYINKYIVSTEDAYIASVAQSCGAEVVFRPKELAEDDTPSLDALMHAVDRTEGSWNTNYDAVAMIPCTNPLKTVEDIDGAIRWLIESKVDSVIGVGPAYPVERIKRLVGLTIVETYPEPPDGQRQKLPKYYIRNGSIYAVRRDALSKLWGHESSLAWVMPKERSVNIDDELDWMLAEMLLNERPAD